MNTKGFTLIELTAIIVVLAAIFLVSFPSLLNTAKSDEDKKYDDMVEDLCLAGESYIYANIEYLGELTVGESLEINIETLINYGNIDNDLKNPETGISVENDILKYTILSDYSLECEYKES